MGPIDRVLRAIIGTVLISLVFVGPQTLWGWFGIVLLVTALSSWCPFYIFLEISTRSKDRDSP